MAEGVRKQLTSIAAAAAVVVAAGACTVKNESAPPLSGPSESALSLTVTATPDSISHDGSSQSSIQVVARDVNGKAVVGLPLRLDMSVNGVVQDYGTLSSRSIVTGDSGRATAVYTAPAPPPVGATVPTCTPTIFSPTVSGQCINIVATPTSTAFQTVTAAFVTLRLVPVGEILPPGATPTATFQYSAQQPATSPTAGVPVVFDATGSCGGPMVSGQCTASSPITSFTWNFGDGTGGGTGSTTSHTFANVGTFAVTLTVKNDRGLSASTTQSIVVTQASAPSAAFEYSPQSPTAGSPVFFNAGTSVAPAGRTIVSYAWDFGDGSPHATGVNTSHTYTTVNAYVVILQVTDDLGRTATVTKQVTVK